MASTSPGVTLAVALSLLLVAGYLWGSVVNRRVRRMAAGWARRGLSGLPDGATIRTLGTAGFLIQQPRPRPGLDDLQLTVLLAPREVLPLWLWHRLTRRSDLVVLRVALATAAAADLEIVARASPFGRTALRGLNEAEGWKVVHRNEAFTIGARRTKNAAPLGQNVLSLLAPAIPGLAQISMRRGNPTVQVGFPLPRPEVSLGPMLDALAAVAERLREGS
jgi:hypothetical protein